MKQYDLPPRPSSLIESMRDIGYSFETAIADLIDNCITANANSIDIRFSWNNGSPWLAIYDNGKGMDELELVNAMRLGSSSPLDIRDKNDLGRFGLGLKTASFSQCRRFTVLTKKNHEAKSAFWDIDNISNQYSHEWLLSLYDTYDFVENQVGYIRNLYDEFERKNSTGTIVLWEKIDRLDEATDKTSKEVGFNQTIEDARRHISLIFHRYLSPTQGYKKIEIYFNNNPIEAYDPFNTLKSTELPLEEFLYSDEIIRVQPYILPHHNKVSQQEWKKYKGKNGYLSEQGFYVYRNKRLIIHANWFRLIPKSELTKLLRVQVDIPNSLDHVWKIDIKKSNAFPPSGIRNNLKRIIGKIELSGKRVYKQKGQKITEDVMIPGWNRIAKVNQIFYEINKNHPLISSFLDASDDIKAHHLLRIFELLETSFPRDNFYNDFATEPESFFNVELTKDKIEALLDFIINPKSERPKKNYLRNILETVPFATHKKLTEQIFNERRYDY